MGLNDDTNQQTTMKNTNSRIASVNHGKTVDAIPEANVVAVLPADRPPVQVERFVEIVAPSDLPGAFQLHVEENGHTLVVVVVSNLSCHQ